MYSRLVITMSTYEKFGELCAHTRGYLLDMTIKEAIEDCLCNAEIQLHPNEYVSKYPLPSTMAVTREEKLAMESYEKTPLRSILYVYMSDETAVTAVAAVEKIFELWENVVARK